MPLLISIFPILMTILYLYLHFHFHMQHIHKFLEILPCGKSVQCCSRRLKMNVHLSNLVDVLYSFTKCVFVCVALDFRIQTTKEEDFGLVLTTSTKASGTCLYWSWSWSSCLHPKTKREKTTTHNKKWIGNTPNVLDTCKPLQAIVPKCFATAFALLYVFRSKWLNELSNMCACVYTMCFVH